MFLHFNFIFSCISEKILQIYTICVPNSTFSDEVQETSPQHGKRSRDIIIPETKVSILTMSMNVLINGSPTAIGRAVVDQIADSGHNLRLTSMDHYDEQDIIVCALEHDEATDDLVAGIDTIINVGYQDEVDMGATFHLDYYTRRTYNLLWAASNAGVKRVVNLSTLRLMEEYEENLVVTEIWRSKPLASDINLLCAHLVEIICKEYARDQKFEVVNLRLGWPLVPVDKGDVNGDFGTAALRSKDLGRAVLAALETDVEPWQDIHIQSTVPNQRYTTAKAAATLGF